MWRSAADREACRQSAFTDPNVRRSDPPGTAACEYARLAPALHRSPADVMPSDPACGPSTTITYVPPDRGRLARLTGCIGAAQLDAHAPTRLEHGAWIFVVDVRELAGEPTPNLRRIGGYPTWSECERVRRVVRDDLAQQSDTEDARRR